MGFIASRQVSGGGNTTMPDVFTVEVRISLFGSDITISEC